MKTLFILKQEPPDDTLKIILAESEKASTIIVVNLQEQENWDSLVDLIEKCDRVITW